MLAKLLKHDIKNMHKNMLVFYILAIFFALLTRIFFGLGKSTIMVIISEISAGCLISMLVSILINTLMRSWVGFRNSVFKDEGYLTHTLPVTKNEIYNSKFIQSVLFLTAGFVVIIVSLFLAYYTDENRKLVKVFVTELSKSVNFNTALFILAVFVIFFLEVLNTLQCGYLGILLGHRKNSGKIGFSVLFGFIVYMASQCAVVLMLFVVGLFNSSILDLFRESEQMNTDSFKLLALLAIIIYLIIIGIVNIISKKVFNKGVNLE